MSSLSALRADLQLEDAVAAQVQHPFRLGDVRRRIARCERPGDRQAIAAAPTQQFADRQAKPLAVRIEQRRLHRALGKAVLLHHLADARHQRLHAGRILPGHHRREISIDGELHALGAFPAIGESADRGALADANDPVAAMDLHQHQRLPVHRGDRQLMWPDSGQVDEHRLDPFDDGDDVCGRSDGCENLVHEAILLQSRQSVQHHLRWL